MRVSPRFGTIVMELPLSSNPVEAGLEAQQIGLAYAGTYQRGGFDPQTMDQQIELPDWPTKTHPYVSPRGDQVFQRQDVNQAVDAIHHRPDHRVEVTINETRLPFDTLARLMVHFLQATHVVTGRPMNYRVEAPPMLKKTYELLMDTLGEMVFQTYQRRPGTRPELLSGSDAE